MFSFSKKKGEWKSETQEYYFIHIALLSIRYLRKKNKQTEYDCN